MRSFIVGPILLLLAGGVAAQDKKYESKDGKYAVGFPDTPATESKKVGETTMHTAAVEVKGLGFMVIYADLPADAVKTAKPEDILSEGEKGLVTSFKAKVTKSQPTTFGKDKYPARQVSAEVLVDTTTIHLRLMLVYVNGRVYQVLGIGSKDAVGGPTSEKFFDSFEIKK